MSFYDYFISSLVGDEFFPRTAAFFMFFLVCSFVSVFGFIAALINTGGRLGRDDFSDSGTVSFIFGLVFIAATALCGAVSHSEHELYVTPITDLDIADLGNLMETEASASFVLEALTLHGINDRSELTRHNMAQIRSYVIEKNESYQHVADYNRGMEALGLSARREMTQRNLEDDRVILTKFLGGIDG